MFSTQLGDALTQGLIASMNPMNQIAQSMFTQQAEAARLQLDKDRKAFIRELRTELKQAIEDQEDADVIDGYRRLLARHTGKQ